MKHPSKGYTSEELWQKLHLQIWQMHNLNGNVCRAGFPELPPAHTLTLKHWRERVKFLDTVLSLEILNPDDRLKQILSIATNELGEAAITWLRLLHLRTVANSDGVQPSKPWPRRERSQIDIDMEAISFRKPPLGILPESLWHENRLADLLGAVGRYSEAGMPVPDKWRFEIRQRQEDMLWLPGNEKKGEHFLSTKQLWICGKAYEYGQRWEFQGVFDTEEKAKAACLDSCYFSGPATLNKTLPDEPSKWEGAYWPNCEETPKTEHERPIEGVFYTEEQVEKFRAAGVLPGSMFQVPKMEVPKIFTMDSQRDGLQYDLATFRKFGRALEDVIAERFRQNDKWGEQNYDDFTFLAILVEEVGEFAKAALHSHFGGPEAQNLRTEMIHSAAVALQIVEAIDRRTAQFESRRIEKEASK